ncbi:polysaccharide pyruvyl transferase family protein [Siccirubricoccus deserti]
MPRSQKVGILTFHRCINYGSYWQARAIVEGLRQRGHEAVLLDHQSNQVNRAEWKCALRPTLPTPTLRSDYPLYAAKARKFFEAFASLPLSRPFSIEDPADMEPVDVVLVGSDEVWNFYHPWYAGYPLFFGEGLKAKRLVSYAASFGNYQTKSPLEEKWASRLRRFTAIGVRDENSRRLIQESLNLDPALVLDPCLQFDTVCRREPIKGRRNQAVVYGHGFPNWYMRSVRAWADARGVHLISLGYRNEWADEQRLTTGPEEFAQAMANARAVATNFFHGCVFALLNAKPFVCAPSEYRSNKVAALVATVGAHDHLVTQEAPKRTLIVPSTSL